MRGPSRIRLALAAALLLPGCGPAPGVGVRPGDARCRQQADQERSVVVDAAASVSDGRLPPMAGDFGATVVQSLRTQFDTLQRDWAALSFQLCEDHVSGAIDAAEYRQRRRCLDNGLLTMRRLQLLSGVADAPTAAFQIEAAIDAANHALRCEPAEPAGAAADAPPGLTAYLVCKRRQPGGGYVDVPTCDLAELREGDRVKIGVQLERPAHLYVLAYNTRNQFQTVFPPPGAPNRAPAGRALFLPAGDAWLDVDDVGGVTEIVQVVAAARPLPELEALRGRDDPPGPALSDAVRVARALLEPVMTRGYQLPPAAALTLATDDGEARAVPVPARRGEVEAVQLQFVHR